MKRYKAINFEYDDAYGTGTALDIVEHDEGEFVKYDDIKHLLQNTSYNSDYMSALETIIKEGVENEYAVQEIVLAVQRLNQRS
jgi:hypothetical protein